MKQDDQQLLPTCPLSVHCLRFLDDLDILAGSQRPPDLDSLVEDDTQDQRMLARLRAHISGCQTCSTLLRQARAQRSQQRNSLRELMLRGERLVPSAAEGIMAEVRAGQLGAGRAVAESTNNHHHEVAHFAIVQDLRERHNHTGSLSLANRSRSRLQNILTIVAVAVIVLASVGLFGRFMVQRMRTALVPPSTPSGGESATSFSGGWDAIMISSPSSDGSGQTSLSNYDAFSGESIPLSTPCCLPDTVIDGISHHGDDLLYHNFAGGLTHYHLLGREVAALNCQCSNAVWSTDDMFAVVDTTKDVVQLDMRYGTKKLLLPLALQATNLAFYNAGYLYFNRDEFGQNRLYRINTVTRQQSLIVKDSLYGANGYWLSPDGLTIYYTEATGSGRQIYAVNEDGTDPRPLRSDCTPIGFAADNSLMVWRKVNTTFQVVKLGASHQQDQVVLTDAAPGASSVVDQEIALAPFGRALVVQASYANRSVKVWADNLVTGQKRVLMHAPASTSARGPVALLGWDRLPTSRTTATVGDITPTPDPSSPGWNGLLFARSKGTSGSLSLANYNYQNGHALPLNPDQLSPDAQVDGVSPDGLSFAYHLFDGGKTSYYTISLVQNSSPVAPFYSVNGQGGNAIWMGAHKVLINMPTVVIQVDTQTGNAVSALASLDTPRLVFYHDPFLYFIGGETRQAGALYRISLAPGNALQMVTQPSPGSTFWLSPDGGVVYYINKGTVGSPGIYVVSSNGMNWHRLRSDGVPIGYAADNSLMIMREVGGKFEVVQLGSTPQQDQPVLTIAPGAVALCEQKPPSGDVPICDQDVALAPYGHALVVQAYYSDGSHKVLAYDLISGTSSVLLSASSATHVQLFGWDQVQPQ